MKKIILSLAAATLFFTGCHQPDELLPSVSRQGINSVTAQFVRTDDSNKAEFYGEFKGYPVEGSDEIIVEIPWFYPESSDDAVTASMLDNMRITLNLDDNVTVTPAVIYMNLNQDNLITVTDQVKNKKVYKVRGQITKSNKCELEELTISSLGLSGIINQDTREVAMIIAGEVEPSTAEYRVSYHATISPDPSTTALDWNNDITLTVTAHNGVDKTVYTVKKEIPAKVPKGIRKGSATKLWEKKLYLDLGIATVNMTGGMAVTPDYIVLNTRGENSVVVNRKTGVKVKDYELPATTKGSLVNFYNTADRDGNILLCNLSPNAGSFKIWKIAPDLATAPELYIEWAGGLAVGRCISVQGSINGDAIITAGIHTAAGQFARWQVTGGVLKSQTPEIITISGVTWTNNNVDIVYTDGSDITSNYFVASYGGGNTQAVVNGKTNTLISKLTDPVGGNYVCNRVDYANFNNYGYMTFSSFNGFTWGGGGGANATTDCCWMLDANLDNPFSGAVAATNPIWIMNSGDYMSRSVANGGVANGNTTGDVAFYQSPDGYFLYMYMMITNGHLVAWQFDCIDK